jgi:hypothetical protein
MGNSSEDHQEMGSKKVRDCVHPRIKPQCAGHGINGMTPARPAANEVKAIAVSFPEKMEMDFSRQP